MSLLKPECVLSTTLISTTTKIAGIDHYNKLRDGPIFNLDKDLTSTSGDNYNDNITNGATKGVSKNSYRLLYHYSVFM